MAVLHEVTLSLVQKIIFLAMRIKYQAYIILRNLQKRYSLLGRLVIIVIELLELLLQK